MENTVSRPKNEDLGKPLRNERIPVQVSAEEKREIEAAANAQGMPASSWMRWLAIREARKNGD